MEIRISTKDWWENIDDLKGLPAELIGMLKSLISATLKNNMLPTATPQLMRLAQEHLQDPIWIDRKCFSIWAYTPNIVAENKRSFFILVRQYPDGELKKLSEI